MKTISSRKEEPVQRNAQHLNLKNERFNPHRRLSRRCSGSWLGAFALALAEKKDSAGNM